MTIGKTRMRLKRKAIDPAGGVHHLRAAITA